VQDPAALPEHRLFSVGFGHGPLEFLKKLSTFSRASWLSSKRHTGRTGRRFGGPVVGGRSQPAGHDATSTRRPISRSVDTNMSANRLPRWCGATPQCRSPPAFRNIGRIAVHQGAGSDFISRRQNFRFHWHFYCFLDWLVGLPYSSTDNSGSRTRLKRNNACRQHFEVFEPPEI
jgi:hypothetical protein